MANITYDIKETLVSVGDGSGWNLELNLISWNNSKPKYDLRKWSDDREKMSKGVTLSEDEVIALFSEANTVLEKLGADCIPKVEEDTSDVDTKLPFED